MTIFFIMKSIDELTSEITELNADISELKAQIKNLNMKKELLMKKIRSRFPKGSVIQIGGIV